MPLVWCCILLTPTADQELSSITKMPVPIYTGSGIFIIDSQNPFLLFYKCFYFFADAVCIKSVFLDQFNCRTRFPERIHNTNLQNRCREFFRKHITYSTSKSTDNRMFFYGNNFSCLFCCCNNKFFINRFDRMDIATIVTSLPSRSTIPFPISNL